MAVPSVIRRISSSVSGDDARRDGLPTARWVERASVDRMGEDGLSSNHCREWARTGAAFLPRRKDPTLIRVGAAGVAEVGT